MSLLAAATGVLILAMAAPAFAEEGMWTFDDAPTSQVRADLGVRLERPWLDRLEGASVRLTSGCSGAVVSPAGLVLTNQHCILDCEQSLSSAAADVIADGLLAADRTGEARCPALAAEVLEGISDVTTTIFAASAGKTGEDYVASRQAALAEAERGVCGGDPALRCQVISFFGGGQFKVYKYRRYDDVRLVFAPEAAVAFFGGDPDNFNFPRYALDCAFLRLYDAAGPARTPDFLPWSRSPPKAGEAVFVSGNPGLSQRSLTREQLESLRDLALPMVDTQNAELLGRVSQFSSVDAAHRRAAAATLFELENAAKLLRGQRLALADPALYSARTLEAVALEARVAVDPRLAGQVGDPWTEIANVQKTYRDDYAYWRELESAAGGGSRLFGWARTLLRAGDERIKAPAARLPEYADQRLPLIAKGLLDPTPIDPAFERLLIEFWLAKTQEALGADAPAVRTLLGGEDPAGLARRLAASRLADPAYRRALWEGGAAAIAASTDPLIVFLRATDPLSRASRTLWEEDVVGPTQRASERIERARFAARPATLYPEATFSLRLSYGRVAANPPDGQPMGPFTRLDGLFHRAGGADPYRLTPRWTAARARLDPQTILDFETTNDIVGGNSGSPVVDASGQVVGAAFDGNTASIAGDFFYDPAHNRTIAVSTAAISEALAEVYGRDDLVRELNPQ